MTHDEVIAMMAQTGLPFAYGHFAQGESPRPPFLVFLFPEGRHFAADGKVYYKGKKLNMELYTDRKDPSLEDDIEAVLDSHGLFYAKSEVYIASERLYEVLYQTEV